MKRNVFAVLALLLTLSSTRLAHAELTPKNLTFARTHYAQIERDLKSYTRINVISTGHPPKDSAFAFFYQKGVPRKIVALFYSEIGQSRSEYYFWGGRLFFSLNTRLLYDSSYGKVVKRTQNRFYFANGKLFRWIDENGKNADLKSAQAARYERENLDEARQYLTKANKLLH